MADYQVVKLEDVDDWLGDYPGEMRGITYAIGAEQVALTHRRMPQHTGSKGSYGHRHRTQEEIYFVLSGKLQFKLDDEVVELGPAPGDSHPAAHLARRLERRARGRGARDRLAADRRPARGRRALRRGLLARLTSAYGEGPTGTGARQSPSPASCRAPVLRLPDLRLSSRAEPAAAPACGVHATARCARRSASSSPDGPKASSSPRAPSLSLSNISISRYYNASLLTSRVFVSKWVRGQHRGQRRGSRRPPAGQDRRGGRRRRRPGGRGDRRPDREHPPPHEEGAEGDASRARPDARGVGRADVAAARKRPLPQLAGRARQRPRAVERCDDEPHRPARAGRATCAASRISTTGEASSSS